MPGPSCVQETWVDSDARRPRLGLLPRDLDVERAQPWLSEPADAGQPVDGERFLGVRRADSDLPCRLRTDSGPSDAGLDALRASVRESALPLDALRAGETAVVILEEQAARELGGQPCYPHLEKEDKLEKCGSHELL